jgi:hypothetical protein
VPPSAVSVPPSHCATTSRPATARKAKDSVAHAVGSTAGSACVVRGSRPTPFCHPEGP